LTTIPSSSPPTSTDCSASESCMGFTSWKERVHSVLFPKFAQKKFPWGIASSRELQENLNRISK
jgi:hypothetical protein